MRADTYLVELNVPPYPVPIQKQNKAKLRPTDKAVEVLMDGVNLLSVPITKKLQLEYVSYSFFHK